MLKFQDKEHTFIIVLNDFPLPEDGIIGVPFLYSYKFNLSNNTLQLVSKIHALVSLGIIIPKNSIKMIKIHTGRKQGYVLIENNPRVPDSIYRICDSQIIVPISNETEIQNEPTDRAKSAA